VCAVIGPSAYIAATASHAVEVELRTAARDGRSAQVARARRGDIRKDKKDRRTTSLSTGRRATRRMRARARRIRRRDKRKRVSPRIHVASMETAAASPTSNRGRASSPIYMTTQAPHAVRDRAAWSRGHVGLSRENPRRVPDIGGASAGKVPVTRLRGAIGHRS